MTILEQRFLETVPTRLSGMEEKLGVLNETLSRLTERLDSIGAPSKSGGVLHDSTPLNHNPIMDADGAARLLKEELQNLDHEEVWILLLNPDLRPIKKEQINIGSLTQTILDARRIVKSALDNAASSIILYHNHPSSNPIPSEEDIKRTSELKDSLKVFDIGLVDHIIIGGNGSTYYSFAEEQVKSLKIKQ